MINCDEFNIQYQPNHCVPKIKYFGITDEMILFKDYDINGNIKTICINPCHPNKPSITINEGVVFYLNKLTNEYIRFDQENYKNICGKAYIDNIYDNDLTYSISIEQIDFSEVGIISNLTLYRPYDYFIKDVSKNGEIINFFKEENDIISNLFEKRMKEIDGESYSKNICQKAFYYTIDKDKIEKTLYDENQDINSLIILDNILEKPQLTLNNKILYFLNDNNEYQKFQNDFYQNIDVKVYQPSDFFNNEENYIDNFYYVRIFKKDPSKDMILGDKQLNSFQNYELIDVLDDQTIEYRMIPNYLSSLLQ